MSEPEFSDVYRDNFEALCRYLGHKFPRLSRADCEDLVQLAAEETLRKVRDSGFKPQKDWYAWLRWLASNRALDYLRQFELASFQSLATRHGESSDADWQPPETGNRPSEVLAEAERRGRQTVLFSDILQEYCRHCEQQKMRKQKEIYERTLREQKPAKIADAMGISRGSVDVHLKRARDWVLERVRQADVHCSVFETFHRRWRRT